MLFLAAFVISCAKEQKKYQSCAAFDYSDVHFQEKLHGEILNMEGVLNPSNLYIHDSILFVVNRGKEFFVTCYNLNNFSLTGEFINFGSGPGELLDLKSLQFVDSTIWAFDKQRNKLFKYSYSQFLTPGNIIPDTVITVADNMSNRALVVNDKIFANSVTYPDFRFSIFNKAGIFMNNIGEYPNSGDKMTTFEKIESFFCNTTVSPDNKFIFVAYAQTDLIEIYDNTGVIKYRMHGPDHFFPHNQELTAEEKKRVVAVRGKTRDAYFYPTAFNDEIWVWYSGKVFDPSSSDYYLGNKVIVFNWDGYPTKVYTTDIPFFTLAIDKKNRFIYGVTPNPDYTIVRFRF